MARTGIGSVEAFLKGSPAFSSLPLVDTRRVIVLTAWAADVKPDLSTLAVDPGLTGLPDVAGIDTVIPRLKVPLIFKSRPRAPQPSQGRGPWRRRKTSPLWWTDGVGQADPGHLRLRGT